VHGPFGPRINSNRTALNGPGRAKLYRAGPKKWARTRKYRTDTVTQISTSQEHVSINNLINLVPFAAGMPGNAGMAGAGNLQLGTKRYQTKPSDSASEWQ